MARLCVKSWWNGDYRYYINLTPNPLQEAVLRTDLSSNVHIEGGRRSGRTTAVVMRSIQWVVERDMDVLIVGVPSFLMPFAIYNLLVSITPDRVRHMWNTTKPKGGGKTVWSHCLGGSITAMSVGAGRVRGHYHAILIDNSDLYSPEAKAVVASYSSYGVLQGLVVEDT